MQMTEFSKQILFFCFEFWALKIRICFEFRLPARSRFGEGRDFVLRISSSLKDQHGIAIAIEPVFLLDGLLIGLH